MGCCSSGGSPNPLAIDATHFDVLRPIGKGGFGRVSVAKEKTRSRLVALKKIEKFRLLEKEACLRAVWRERAIMPLVSSPFLCPLFYAFHTDAELYLVMPYLSGGDLRFHLKERGIMTEDACKFYAAELVCGLVALHDQNIIYRDLKPDNILLDGDGHLVISDFGLAYVLSENNNFKAYSNAGTKGYKAPEVRNAIPYGKEADIYSFGVTIYELMHGYLPYKKRKGGYNSKIPLAGQFVDVNSNNPMLSAGPDSIPNADGRGGAGSLVAGSVIPAAETVNNSISPPNANAHVRRHSGELTVDSATSAYIDQYEIHVSRRLSPEARSFLRGLLDSDVTKRLGCSEEGWTEIRKHPWFATTDWARVERRELTPAIKPDPNRVNCLPNAIIDEMFHDSAPRRIAADKQNVFSGWSWNVELAPEQPEERLEKNKKVKKTSLADITLAVNKPDQDGTEEASTADPGTNIKDSAISIKTPHTPMSSRQPISPKHGRDESAPAYVNNIQGMPEMLAPNHRTQVSMSLASKNVAWHGAAETPVHSPVQLSRRSNTSSQATSPLMLNRKVEMSPLHNNNHSNHSHQTQTSGHGQTHGPRHGNGNDNGRGSGIGNGNDSGVTLDEVRMHVVDECKDKEKNRSSKVLKQSGSDEKSRPVFAPVASPPLTATSPVGTTTPKHPTVMSPVQSSSHAKHSHPSRERKELELKEPLDSPNVGLRHFSLVITPHAHSPSHADNPSPVPVIHNGDGDN